MRKWKDDDDAAAANMKPGVLFEIMGMHASTSALGSGRSLEAVRVDVLGIVIMTRFSIYALRVRPQLSARQSIRWGILIGTSVGFGFNFKFMKTAALGLAQ